VAIRRCERSAAISTFYYEDRTACSEQSEGIFFAPRDDTGIIAFVLNLVLFWCGFDLSDLCFVMSFVGDLILLI
jgi:hypothetical protein